MEEIHQTAADPNAEEPKAPEDDKAASYTTTVKKRDVSTRAAVIETLKKSYTRYYNVHEIDDDTPIAARCDYFEHSERYFLSKKAELWSADSEEFLYIVDIPHLTLEEYEKWRDYVYEDGMKRVHIVKGHMYSYITPVFICDSCDEDALKALKKCRIYKSFHFSLYGWMDYHTAIVVVPDRKIDANMGGHETAKTLKNVLYS